MKGYGRAVNRILVVVLALNAAVAIAKLTVGARVDSLALLGDGAHSGVDAANNVVALVLMYYATKPADENHPFGHSKVESLGAFLLAGLLFVTAFELAKAAVARAFLDPVTPAITPFAVGVLLVTLVVNVAVSTLERRAGERLGSHLLTADASHTRADVYVTLAVLGSFAGTALGHVWLDPVIAIGVSFVIGWSGFRIFKQTAPVLTDATVYDPAEVDRLVRDVPGVESVHDIRSRGRPGEAFVQMHLVVDTHDVVEAHAISDAVEQKLENALGAKEVFVHVEPEDDDSGPPGTRADPVTG